MHQRDYLMRHLEKLLAVVLALIGRIMGLRPEQLPQMREMLHQELSAALVLDWDASLSLPPGQLASHLLAQGVPVEAFDRLADLLREMGHHHHTTDPHRAVRYWAQALVLYRYAQGHSPVLEFGRDAQIGLLQELLGAEPNHFE